jgi:peroxiredoxin
MKKKTFWKTAGMPLLGAAGVGVLLSLLLSPGGDGGLPEGTPAPAFELTDLAGRTATLQDYRGKVVLLDFWATWCTSCEEEVPELKALHAAFSRDRFDILAVSLDSAGPEVVAEFAADYKLPYRVLFGAESTPQDYRIVGLPTKFLLDKEGRVYRTYLIDTPHAQIEDDIRTLMERKVS